MRHAMLLRVMIAYSFCDKVCDRRRLNQMNNWGSVVIVCDVCDEVGD